MQFWLGLQTLILLAVFCDLRARGYDRAWLVWLALMLCVPILRAMNKKLDRRRGASQVIQADISIS